MTLIELRPNNNNKTDVHPNKGVETDGRWKIDDYDGLGRDHKGEAKEWKVGTSMRDTELSHTNRRTLVRVTRWWSGTMMDSIQNEWEWHIEDYQLSPKS